MIFKGFISIKEEQNNNIFRSILSQINGYFKLKPTSQICLEYQEALLIDSKHGNFVEVIFENLLDEALLSFRSLKIWGAGIAFVKTLQLQKLHRQTRYKCRNVNYV